MADDTPQKLNVIEKYRLYQRYLSSMHHLDHLPHQGFWNHALMNDGIYYDAFKMPSVADFQAGRADPNLVLDGYPLLQWLIMEGNVANVAMLLYWGASVGADTFQLAMEAGNLKIIQLLLEYNQPIAETDAEMIFLELISTWGNVEDVLARDAVAFIKRFPSFFETDVSFLSIFITKCCFSAPNWLSVFYELLNLPNAAQLVQFDPVHDFHNMMSAFIEKSIQKPERTSAIWTWLSLGGKVNMMNLNLAIYFWGFDEEVDALVGSMDNMMLCCRRFYPLTLLILGLEGWHTPQQVLEGCLAFWCCNSMPNLVTFAYTQIPFDGKRLILQALRYITVTPRLRKMLTFHFRNTVLDCPEIKEAINTSPKVPTLLELSRNALRKALRPACSVSKPHQFHDLVRALDAPEMVKDIVRFKRPLYHSSYC